MTRWTRSLGRSRPRGVWFALGAGVLGCVLLTSLYPAVAVAQAGVEQGSQVVPWILGWIDRATGVLS